MFSNPWNENKYKLDEESDREQQENLVEGEDSGVILESESGSNTPIEVDLQESPMDELNQVLLVDSTDKESIPEKQKRKSRKFFPPQKPKSGSALDYISDDITKQDHFESISMEPNFTQERVVLSAYQSSKNYMKYFANAVAFYGSRYSVLFAFATCNLYIISSLVFKIRQVWFPDFLLFYPFLMCIYFGTMFLTMIGLLSTFMKKSQEILVRKGSLSSLELSAVPKWFTNQMIVILALSGIIFMMSGAIFNLTVYSGVINLGIHMTCLAFAGGFLHGISCSLFFAIFSFKSSISSLIVNDTRDLMFTMEHNFSRIVTDFLRKQMFDFILAFVLIPGVVCSFLSTLIKFAVFHSSITEDGLSKVEILKTKKEIKWLMIAFGCVDLLIVLVYLIYRLKNLIRKEQYSNDLEMHPVGQTDMEPLPFEDQVKRIYCFSSIIAFFQGLISPSLITFCITLSLMFIPFHSLTWLLPLLISDVVRIEYFSSQILSILIYGLGSVLTYAFCVKWILPRKEKILKDAFPYSDRPIFLFMLFLAVYGLIGLFSAFFGSYVIPFGGNVGFSMVGLGFAVSLGIYPLIPSLLGWLSAHDVLLSADKWSIRNPVNPSDSGPDRRLPKVLAAYEVEEYRKSFSFAVYVTNKFSRLMASVLGTFCISGALTPFIFIYSQLWTKKFMEENEFSMNINVNEWSNKRSFFPNLKDFDETEFKFNGDFFFAFLTLTFCLTCMILLIYVFRRAMRSRRRNEIFKVDKEMARNNK